jgi:uncharacterized membrane protein YhiD involved in acid resistance
LLTVFSSNISDNDRIRTQIPLNNERPLIPLTTTVQKKYSVWYECKKATTSQTACESANLNWSRYNLTRQMTTVTTEISTQNHSTETQVKATLHCYNGEQITQL